MRSAVTGTGERIGVGDRITTRRNEPDLDVANRDCWTVTAVSLGGGLRVKGEAGARRLPPGYVCEHVELAYASTIHGAQGETVDEAHLLVGEHTSAAAAYVAMTRGRRRNIAHLVAEDLDDARQQWVETFSRNRADLGPTHAAHRAVDDIERYGPNGNPPYLGRQRPDRTPLWAWQRRVPSTGLRLMASWRSAKANSRFSTVREWLAWEYEMASSDLRNRSTRPVVISPRA